MSFGPDHLKAAAEALKARLTLGQFLRGLGKISREELQKYSHAYVALRESTGVSSG